MNVEIITLISPRLEFFYLEDWIVYNHERGVSKITIYNNGFNLCSAPESPSNVTSFHAKNAFKDKPCSGNLSNIWDLKPHLDYFDEYTDSQIEDHIFSLGEKYKHVSFIPWEYGKHQTAKFPHSQFTALRDFLFRTNSDYFIFTDVDEFFQLGEYRSFIQFIENKSFDCCKVKQCPQPKRTRDFTPGFSPWEKNLQQKWGKNITKTSVMKDLVKTNDLNEEPSFKNWCLHDGLNKDFFKTVETEEIYLNHHNA